MKRHKTTIDDVLIAVNGFAAKTDERFDKIDERFEKIDQRFENLENRVGHVENQMVTKEYLDDKLADLKGELISLLRQENKKVEKVVDTLHHEKIFSAKQQKRILSMEPFAKTFI